MKLHKTNLTILLIFALLLMQMSVIGQIVDAKPPPFPDLSKGRGDGSKGGGTDDKLSADLRILTSQFAGSKGTKDDREVAFSEEQLKEAFGIEKGETNPSVSLAVTIKSDADIVKLKDAGMKIYFRKGDVVYGEANVSRLGRLAQQRDVIKISSIKSVKTPPVPNNPLPPVFPNPAGAKGNPTSVPLANEFNKTGLDGKGVIVGVIDSGIDWRHPDFLNPDGTSRILAIWDYFDESYEDSNGTIGTIGPKLYAEGENLWGTVYTNAQINAALKDEGTVNSEDRQGHGTAVAGTAAGNGAVSDGKYAGVAPQADLIIVKASDCGGFHDWVPGAEWILQMAEKFEKPVVINQSFGGHYSAHDGTEESEEYLNSATGEGIPGAIFTVSAGNEGRYNLHATGRFGKINRGRKRIQQPDYCQYFST